MTTTPEPPMSLEAESAHLSAQLQHAQPGLGENRQSVPWRLDNTGRSDRGVLARSSLTLIGRGISKFAVLIFLIVAARLLTKPQYGVYSYVLVLASTFGILADPQVSIIAGRDVAAGRCSPAVGYWSAMPIVFVAGVAAALAMVAFGLIEAGPGGTPGVLLIAGGFIVCNRLAAVGLDMLRAVGRFGLEAAIETTGTVALVTGATVIAALGLGVAQVLLAFLVQSLLVALVCWAALRNEVGGPRWVTSQRAHLVRSGVKLSAAAGATAVATRTPLIVLGAASSAVVVASYSAGLRFVDAAYLLALTAGQALLPNIASLLATDPVRATRLTRRTILFSVLAGLVIVVVTEPLAYSLTRAVFGDKYASSGALLSVMLLSLPFMGMFWISWFALCAYKRERDVVAVALVAAAAAVEYGVILIPGHGARAAAWVYVGVLALLAVGTYGMFERHVRGGGQWSPP